MRETSLPSAMNLSADILFSLIIKESMNIPGKTEVELYQTGSATFTNKK